MSTSSRQLTNRPDIDIRLKVAIQQRLNAYSIYSVSNTAIPGENFIISYIPYNFRGIKVLAIFILELENMQK